MNLGNFFSAMDPILTLLIGVASACVFAFTTFATIDYVDKKHTEVKDVLVEIKDDQKQIQRMIYELSKEVNRGNGRK
jgi:hypothetical protein